MKKQFCGPTDNECLTKSIKEHVYKKFVRGIDGVESSDPLYIMDKIEINRANFKYILYKPILSGMSKCNFMKLR